LYPQSPHAPRRRRASARAITVTIGAALTGTTTHIGAITHHVDPVAPPERNHHTNSYGRGGNSIRTAGGEARARSSGEVYTINRSPPSTDERIIDERTRR
jgi:hypothetical protein